MSKILQRTVPCGSCGKSFEATVFESINTDYAPDVPEQILNGNIFRKKCPRCGATTNVEYDVLYHDLKNGTMVWVLQDKMPDYHEKVAIAKKMFSPYKHTRIVSNIAQLREKILCMQTTDKIPMKSQDQMDESKGTKEKTIDEIEAEKRGLSVDVYIQLKQLEANRKAREEREAQKKRQRKRRLTVLTVIVALIGLALYLFYTRPTEDNASGKSTSTRETSGNPYTNNVLYDYLNGIKNQNTAAATATPKPATIYNGRKFITPDYASVCPFEVKAGSDGDYYIYLKYQKAPTYSQESRKLLSSASYPYESDIAFIVKAGQSYEMDVPIGVYKLYYATGKTFFNTSILFGDTTRYYESDELLTFNASGNYYNGHTITLYEVVNGNLDTDEISEKTFPTR